MSTSSRAQRRIQFFNELSTGWDTRAKHDPNKIEEILSSFAINQGDSVLDVGTGTGILIPHLLKRIGASGKIKAIDCAMGMIEVAREKFKEPNVVFEHADIQIHEFDENFDAVVFYSMFPHIDDKVGAVSNAANFLKPGGRMCICHSDPRSVIDSRHGRNPTSPVAHDMLPHIDEIGEMMTGSGLLVKRKVDNDLMFYIVGEKPAA
ncbi:MAG TPA: class I SAM-dependent methyltransferase [Caldisericia bacterium]|nr:class I SAM-dependent methyltransferase [Caldisericia bacterium]HPF49343.1 class I SAM-dependent methyltransferase [Caldisericia bacterium]HPI84419.1 class I SAM-dependent methyltransferase [Caldisericia bacterium]HPQ93820.1 class I SAM-dependent methyltransferase [Caldisericia bacterium]HRV75616.1 class I SAM-dependent methyltransferase [Caldisericia bacterium]